jgi:hypothetical protein
MTEKEKQKLLSVTLDGVDNLSYIASATDQDAPNQIRQNLISGLGTESNRV